MELPRYERKLILNAARYEFLRNAAKPNDPASLWVARGIPGVGLSQWTGEELDVAVDNEINNALRDVCAQAELVEALESIADMNPAQMTVGECAALLREASQIARYALQRINK